ncbi:hypothetical protein R84981_002867 [Carnimonas sp. R-84981]
MTLTEMVNDLLERGHSTQSIAEACGVSQPLVWRLKSGKDVRYKSGKKVERFYNAVKRTFPKPAA